MLEYFIYTILFVSVILGGAIAKVISVKKNWHSILLSFSSAFLISVVFSHLLPELYERHNFNTGGFIILGFLIQIFLESFSGGVEHGHIHAGSYESKLPWSMILALGVHSIIEGMPIASEIEHHQHESHHFHAYFWGIAVHKLPIGVTLYLFLKAGKVKEQMIWIVLAFFAITTPLGLAVSLNIHQGESETLKGIIEPIMAVSVGMLLHISTTIMFENSKSHKFSMIKMSSILLGALLAFLSGH